MSKGQIMVLAWGSLVWNRGTLAVTADFQPNGPSLPIEFSRVSGDGRLTLIIDEKAGAPCITYTAVSVHNELGEAKENLRIREGMPSQKGVGFIDLISGRQSHTAIERHPTAVTKIRAWAELNGLPMVIWTALASNFHEPGKANKQFSVQAATRYLETRDAGTLRSALNYIRQAPPEIKTPLREAVSRRWPGGG
jgi:hypothetical protein